MAFFLIRPTMFSKTLFGIFTYKSRDGLGQLLVKRGNFGNKKN